MSGSVDSMSLTPAANTNSLRSALYTEGSGRPTRPSTSVMPRSAAVTLSACSEETTEFVLGGDHAHRGSRRREGGEDGVAAEILRIVHHHFRACVAIPEIVAADPVHGGRDAGHDGQ